MYEPRARFNQKLAVGGCGRHRCRSGGLGGGKWKSARPVRASNRELVASFEHYKKWTRVNDPILMSRASAVACFDIPLGSDGSLRHKPDTADDSPHIEKYVVVYVNDIAVKPMFGAEPPVFPVGSIIVKEKHPTRESTTPELLTVMMKREKGFNPGGGDWQYLVADGDARGIRQRDNVEHCQQCHEPQQMNDYVFQTYTPLALARERKKLEEFQRMYEELKEKEPDEAPGATALRSGLSVNAAVPELTDYKAWTLVNPERMYLPPEVSKSCLAPNLGWKDSTVDPAAGSFISVYVNNTGRQAMTESRMPRFPVGSVIVKEKHPTKDDKAPELLTVMIKREKGFNPTSGDWEYLVTDGLAKQVQGRGKLANCMGCHEKRKDADFVFRQYLPKKVIAGLK